MLEFFKKIVKGELLGIDIGTASIKMVEVKSGRRPRLINYGILEDTGHFNRSNSVIQTSTMSMFDREVIRLLKLLKEKTGIKSKRAIVSLPLFAAFTTLIEMPDISDEEVGQTIKYKARQYIPLPISEVTVDWMPVGKRRSGDKDLRQILVISVPTEKIKQYKSMLAGAGFELEALEVESLSSVRAAVGNDASVSLIMDIGSHSTGMMVAQDGFLKTSNQIDYAGNNLTYALAKGLNVGVARAEDLKRQKGLLGSGGAFELSTIMLPFVDVIIKEAIRVKDSFEKTYATQIERIVLAGGGANLLGLDKYIGEQTGLMTVKADPLSFLEYDEGLIPIKNELGASLSVALGLAMRE